jgi:calcium-dependent protein kinase
MLELIGDDPKNAVRKKEEEEINEKKINENIIVSAEKYVLNNLHKNFSEFYSIIDLIEDNVYLCEDLKLGDLKCVRIIDKEKNPVFLSERKIKMLVNLDSPNVIKIFNIFEDDFNIYIVHDYCPEKDIFNFIQNHKAQINEEIIRNIIKEVLTGINYLHQKGIMHKNINPSKLLVFNHNFETNEIQIKISDFATNSEMFIKDSLIYKSFGNRIENPLFFAPEFIEQKYDNKVDIWSFGIVCYLLFVGKAPFKGKPQEIIYQIGHKNIFYPENLLKIKKDFLKKMLNNDPNLRYDANALLKDEYFEVEIDELEKEENENKELSEMVSVMNQICKYSIGNNFRRSILSFIATRKLYEENDLKIKKAFNKLDVNKDGSIEIEELFTYYKKIFPGIGKEKLVKMRKFIESADLNNNGKIEYSEFLTILNVIRAEFDDKFLREIFDYYDYEKNGFIEAKDFKELFEDTNISDQQIHQILDEVDKNEDRKIGFEEFKLLMKKQEINEDNKENVYVNFVGNSAKIMKDKKSFNDENNENNNENNDENNENNENFENYEENNENNENNNENEEN